MKNQLSLSITFIVLWVSSLSGFTQAIPTEFKDAPAAVNKFMEHYPAIRIVDYADLKNGNYIVDFIDEEKEMVFKIDAMGNLMQKETEIVLSDLPEEIKQKVKEAGTMKYAWLIEKNNGEILYLVEYRKKLKYYDQIYTAEGELVPEEEYYASLFQ